MPIVHCIRWREADADANLVRRMFAADEVMEVHDDFASRSSVGSIIMRALNVHVRRSPQRGAHDDFGRTWRLAGSKSSERRIQNPRSSPSCLSFLNYGESAPNNSGCPPVYIRWTGML
jgi:hypothetical protein